MTTNPKIDVLVLDDDPDLCLLIETIVKMENHESARCVSPNQIFNLLEKHNPDLLLMDMFLSGKDGRDICRELKKSEKYANLKILMMSAHTDARESCLAAGADDFIEKPFEVDYLIEAIDKLLDK